MSDSSHPTPISAQIRMARERAGLSQANLATLMGKDGSQSTVARFETGDRIPSPRDMGLLAAALSVTLTDVRKVGGARVTIVAEPILSPAKP